MVLTRTLFSEYAPIQGRQVDGNSGSGWRRCNDRGDIAHRELVHQVLHRRARLLVEQSPYRV